jgi:tripeptidyl-peptidase-1
VGFVNPALYSHPWVLNDIVNGSNPGCGTDGFYAVQGYDSFPNELNVANR